MARSVLTIASVLSVLALSACDEDKGIVDDSETDIGDEDETETEDETEEEPEYFEPIAVGFQYVGGWDSSTGELLNYVYNGKEYGNYVMMTFADIDYFSATDSAAREGHFCDVVTSFYHESASLSAETYDYGSGGGESVALWDSWEGGLYFDESMMIDDACWNLDPAVYTDGMPLEMFNGIHFGMGFGPVSDSIVDWFGDYYADVETSLFGIYQAVNHPDGDGGYDFIAYDWSYSSLYEWDPKTTEVLLDDKGYLIQANIGDPNPQGLVQAGVKWYEDFPNLDLNMIKDGAK